MEKEHKFLKLLKILSRGVIFNMENNYSDEIYNRKKKLENIEKNGEVPFKSKFENCQTYSEFLNSNENDEFKFAGRLTFKRNFGKLMFIRLYDITGSIQVALNKNNLGEENFDFIKKHIDNGDFLGVQGEIFFTKTQEKTIRAKKVTILSKSLLPLPDKFHGIEDKDLRYRKKYLDIISHEESRNIILTRSKILSQIRSVFSKNDFLEVETPILQNVASGASAKPFITKHNALDEDLYLRIAPELYLKQLVASGMNRVFEIGKNFRNEGIDPSHLQEFTMLEWYAAYWNYENNIEFLENLLKEIIKVVHPSLIFTFDNQEFDFNQPWEYIDYCKEISAVIKKDILDITSINELVTICNQYELLTEEEIESCKSLPILVDKLYKKKIRPFIYNPSILYNYPKYMVPLARINDEDERMIDMFQLVINGIELVKSYSELINPIQQEEFFKEQLDNKKSGDEEAMDYDYDFLEAMKHGMPPMSGGGLGIDRLIAILLNQESLKDVVSFPLVKNNFNE